MGTGTSTDPDPAGWRSLAVLLLLATFFAAWFAPGVFGGLVYLDEDVASYFIASRQRLFAMLHGGGFGFWDPLPGLGMPRLGNPLGGTLSPLSLIFYLVPAPRAFGLYPAFVLTLLCGFCFGLFRSRGVGVLPALFGALSFATMGNVITHLQHPPYLETLVWLPATLWAWERFRRSGRGAFAALGGVAFAFQILSGGPQYLLYGAIVMAVFIGSDLWGLRRDRTSLVRATTAAAGLFVSGLALASWLLLPSLELSANSHRTLLSSADAFRDTYRAAPSEVLLALAAEVFAFIEAPVLRYGSPHRNLVNLSLLVPLFALLALRRRPRPVALWIAAGLFLLGMLGSAGGVTTLLAGVFPPAAQLRAPLRMVVPAGFLLCFLAACGMAGWLDGGAGRGRRLAAAAAIGWVALLGWTLKRPADEYADPAAFRVPEAIRTAHPRVAVDVVGSRPPPPRFAINAGIAAGVPVLFPNDALRPRNYFEAIFASQFGSLDQPRKLDALISAPAIPVLRPRLPLMRAFGLHTLIRYEGGRARAVPQPGALDRFFLAARAIVAPEPEQRWAWAASPDWDPRVQVILSDPADARGLPDPGASTGRGGGVVRVLRDEPDAQSVEIDSPGGMLVTQALMYPGWEVSVDGAPARAVEVDLALRGVVVPPGSHRVDWRYRPTWLAAAWTATALGLGLLLALTRLRMHPHPRPVDGRRTLTTQST